MARFLYVPTLTEAQNRILNELHRGSYIQEASQFRRQACVDAYGRQIFKRIPKKTLEALKPYMFPLRVPQGDRFPNGTTNRFNEEVIEWVLRIPKTNTKPLVTTFGIIASPNNSIGTATTRAHTQ